MKINNQKQVQKNYGYNGNGGSIKVLHPSDETIFKAAQDEIDRYMNFKRKERIFGKKIEFSPLFISHSIKFVKSINLNIVDGKFTGDDIVRNASSRTFALVGEKNRGGYQYSTQTQIPLADDYDSLRSNLWLATSTAIERAYSRYSSKLGEIGKAKREFDTLSKERICVDIQKDEETNLDINSIVAALEKATSLVSKCKELSGITSSLDIKNITRYFINSEGTRLKTNDLYIHILLEAGAYDDYGYTSFVKTFTKRKFDQLNIKAIETCGESMIKTLLSIKNCRRQEAGVYPLLIDSTAHGVVWHEAIGHLLEKNPLDPDYESETFKGKLGKRIAPTFLSLECDPTLDGRYGSYTYDDEGVPGQKVILIKKGVLKNFLHSRLTAGKENKHSNGHARAEEDEDDPPVPRMSNLIIRPEKGTRFENLKKQLIELAKKAGKRYGLFCKGFTHGSVEESSGQNEVHPLEIFRIYLDGRTERVKDVYIIGTPHNLINQIIACGSSIRHEESYCVAESGTVPVEEIAPAALLANVEFAREEKRNESAPFLPKP